MLSKRIKISFWVLSALENTLMLLILTQSAFGLVNSPKIITKDGNLIFESGLNRNITFRLSGKSRLLINEQYDLLDLLFLRKRIRNGTSADTGEGGIEWLDGDDVSLRQLVPEVAALKTQVFGPQGIERRLRDLQNLTTNATQNLRGYQTRLQGIETKVQQLNERLELDTCRGNPCENGGTCFRLYNGFMCKCTKNFEGPTCAQDVNECALFAGTDLGCLNGAQCVNQVGSYSCICTPGWYGIHCTQRKGDCLHSATWELCGHGTCVPAAGNDNFGYKCICEQGWKTNGLTPACTIDVDECNESHPPCATKCINLPGSFTCAPCAAGLEGNGVSCSDIDECATNNGGCSLAPRVQCLNSYGSYQCGECPLGWTGNGRVCTRLNTDEHGGSVGASCTDPKVCYPGATCQEISNTVVCTCPPGTVGSGFGRNGCIFGTANNCDSYPCLNGGTCIDTADSYMCICTLGYRQPNCTPIPGPCTPNPCHNNGRCRATNTTAFECECAPGYEGRLCDGHMTSCGGVLAGLTGRLKYPEGSQYEHNSQCAWLLRTNETKVLNITFNSFDLEDATECRFDWLQINDGRTAAAQVIGRFCGATKPLGGNIISSTNQLYLWFRSDNSTAKAGFELVWNSIPPQCGGVINVESHGTIATPGSPGVYPKNRDCRWRLRASNSKRIKLTFFSMQIENHSSCNNDYVEIFDDVSDTLIEKFCNSSRPAPLLVPSNEVGIHFHSDDEGEDTGFQIYYSLEERLPGCGGTFTNKAGVISSPTLSNDSISCEYDITMPLSESIIIEFTKFELGPNDCIELYDISVDKHINDMQSKYCGSYNFMPEIFHSQYNAVRIKFYAKSGQFELKYKADCFYTYDSATGEILSPGYPTLDKTEHICTYKILTEPNTVISVKIVDFELRDSSLEDNDCAYTSLSIKDDLDQNVNSIGPYCNDQEPPTDFVSKSNMLTLLFQSGATSLGKGFKIEYRALPMASDACGGVYTKLNYTIRLPTGDDGQYAHDMDCYWVIMAPPGKGIAINWLSFDLEESSECYYDYIEIFDNLASTEDLQPFGKYCGTQKPPSFVSHSRIMTIKFSSDYSEARDGFEATYSFIDITNHCGGEIYSSTGKIYTPGWPANYSNDIDCKWIIGTPPNTQMELQVEMFELQGEFNDEGCKSDWLEIRNGGSVNSTLIGQFCGTKIPRTIPSFTNQLHLEFHTDSFVSARGFVISWKVFSNGCGGILRSEAGIISSPLYPQKYLNRMSCEWSIFVHKGSAIHITIEDIDIESSSQCTLDHLRIFDGMGAGIPIVNLCTTQYDDDEKYEFATSGNQALVRFRTDSSITQRGFLLSYYANCTRTIRDLHGAIESPNYGEFYYRNNINCAWTLKAPKGNKFNLELTYFELSAKATKDDYLYLMEPLNNRTKTTKIKEIQTYNSEGDTLVIIQNSTGVAFRLEYAVVGCVAVLHRESGEFQTPNYPQPYPNDVECRWDIVVAKGQGIELTVENMDIEESVNCTKDGLVISNEHRHNPKDCHCGVQKSLVITSSAHRLFVSFYSDLMHNGKGFKASYKTINTTCGGNFVGRNGVITSPNYPLNYPQNVHCEWNIAVAEDHTIKITLDELDIEDFYECQVDYVEVFENIDNKDVKDEDDDYEDEDNKQQKLFRKCGTLQEDSQTVWQTTSNKATVAFASDDSYEMKGFKLHFEESCGKRVIIADDDDSTGVIDIVKHGRQNENCVWQIIAKNSAKQISLTITHVMLTPLLTTTYKTDADCAHIGVKVYDGQDADSPLRAEFCKTHPPAIISNGHALTIQVPLNVITEFSAQYELMDKSCGGYLNAVSGKFSSPYYPSSYPVNVDCQWTIMPKEGNSLVLTFETMSLEDSDDCNKDYVEVREKNDGKLLGVYCGSTIPPPFHGVGSLWLNFKSDNDIVSTGFIASYNYERHNELSGIDGIIESPKYPSKFHETEPYTWRITVDKDYVVLLSIKHIVDVDKPFIKFYDGYSDIGAELDYSTSNVIRSNTNILYLVASHGPFRFEWERLEKYAHRANRTAEENAKVCGEKLVSIDSAITFTSPGYPRGYADNMDCSWFILAKDTTMHPVLRFAAIDLEEFSDCFADYVAVSTGSDLENWKQLDKLCKKNESSDKSYEGTPYLKLDFHTDSSNNKTGFSAQLRNQCGSALTDSKGFVNATNFADGFSAFPINCIWTISVKPGRRLRVTFPASYLKPANETTSDCVSYFLVRNGIDEDSPFLGKGKYCENDIEDVLETTANHAFIKFVYAGFPECRAAFRYEELRHECSDELTLEDTPTGRMLTINSPNYPNIANPHTECVWKITAPVHHIIAVHFMGKFELSTGSGPIATACDREYVQLNDGITDLMPSIGRYCGNTKPDTQYTTGNVLRVKYFTEVSEPKAGFMANITIGQCGGLYYGDTGIVRSPEHLILQGAKDDVECVYTFEGPSDSTVQLNIDMRLPEEENCTTTTHLELREIDVFSGVDNITNAQVICGKLNRTYVFETNKVAIHYRIKDTPTSEHKFSIQYTMLGSRCGETIVASAGILQTPGYPNGVSRFVHCLWRLRAPAGRRIKIEFLDFDTVTAPAGTQTTNSFRGRLAFANDLQMQSIIARITDNPPAVLYSTCNTMSIDAFVLPAIKHRGFRLRFTSDEDSVICNHSFDLNEGGTLEFRNALNNETYCQYELTTPANHTLALVIDKYSQYETNYMGSFFCEVFAPVKFEAYEQKLMRELFCKNTTFPYTIRVPYPLTMSLMGSKRNQLIAVDIKYNLYDCGGIVPVFAWFNGENTTITAPVMNTDYTGRLDCAWAVWPHDGTFEYHDKYLRELALFEVALTTNLKGKCEDEYLILYSGPDQNSPEIGRYCDESKASHIVTTGGLFVEYYSANYETQTKFNITLKPGSGCGGKLMHPYRRIGIYNEYYQNNIECIWEMTTDPGFHMAVKFVDRFFIESSPDCKKDYLRIQQRSSSEEDWIDLKTLCGREAPEWVNSTATQMRLIFRTDADGLADGFIALPKRVCGGLLHATHDFQELQSPGYPDLLPHDLYCNYTIISTDEGNRGVLVRFKDFEIEAAPTNSCIFDNVTVISQNDYDSLTESKVLCGKKSAHEYRSQKSISLIVQTDSTYSSKGFLMEYTNLLCGGHITDFSIIQSPHQHDDGNFPPNSKCIWNITAPAAHKILIKFEELDYENQMGCPYDYVEVYNGTTVNEAQRLAKLCGNMTGRLPMLSVPHNKAIIRSVSDAVDPSKGFKAIISFIQNCDKEIYLSNATQSYNFTSLINYQNNLDCAFVFKTDPGRQFAMEFNSFHVEETVGCTDDYLEIRDGAGPFADLIGRYCGHNAPTRLITSRHALFLHFVSDHAVTDSGLTMTIRTAPLECGSHSLSLNNHTSLSLKSPGFDEGRLLKNLNCYWKIKAEGNIHVKFHKLDIEDSSANSTCDNNYLKMYNSDDAAMIENGYGSKVTFNGYQNRNIHDYAAEHFYCGKHLPDDYFSTSHEMFIKLKTDNNAAGTGVSMTITQATGCFRNFTGTQGRILIAETTDHCDIYINAPQNYSLALYFAALSFSEYDCDAEYVEVFNAHTNTSIKKLCNYVELGKSLFTTTNEIRMRIKMHLQYTRYDITYLASLDGPGCGGDFYNTGGTFTNPFYPDNVRNNSDCRWNIRVPANLHVFLLFDAFDLGAKSTCVTDYLQIIERKDDGVDRVVRQYCGGDNPKYYKSELSSITVRFHKTMNYDGTGWIIRFNGVYSNYKIPSYYIDEYD